MYCKLEVLMHPLIKNSNNTFKGSPVEFTNVIELKNKEDWVALDKCLISRDEEGRAISFFKDDIWYMGVYASDFQVSQKTNFDFSFINSSEKLTLELKLIVYGWIFYKNSTRSNHVKIQTLVNRLSALKKVYIFLNENNYNSISELNNKVVSQKLDTYLMNKDLAQRTLEHVFSGINSIIRLQSWLNLDLPISLSKPYEHALKLSNKSPQQTLSIPERIADELYAKAIELVEDFYPHRDLLATIEKELQENYLAGKEIVNQKKELGIWKFLDKQEKSSKLNHMQAQEISKVTPFKTSDILSRYSSMTLFKDLKSVPKWKKLYGRITTACYICCGAFSGMRDSELSALKPDSYYCDDINGQKFHFIRSKTFKLGEKDTTWVTAPITQKAVELMSCFTKYWRKELLEKGLQKESEYLWLNRTARSKLPVVISKWPDRLQLFSETYGTVIKKEDLVELVKSNPNALDNINKLCILSKSWPLKPHQFRRSLALYTIKHRLGSCSSLQQQFKHTYLQMTEWYSVGGIASRLSDLEIDNDFQQLLENTKLEETTNKFFSMVHGDSTLSGSHGKAIMDMREDIPYIYSSWDVIYAAVKKGTLSLHGTMTAYCKNGYNCDMDGVINPAFCINCKTGGSIIDENQARNWQDIHNKFTSYLKDKGDVSPSVYAHSIIQIRAAESIMTDFNIAFEPYTHPIEVVQL